mgnify:CR=1 FL=1
MLIIARFVGFLVATVAIVVGISLLMGFRALIAVGISNLGVIGLSAVLGLLLWCAMTYGRITPKTVWIIFSRGCL